MPIGLLLSCAALLSVCAEGPERATLTGSVADPSHAVIPGARLELTNAETSEVTTALTDHQGRYTVSTLRAGSYSVSIEAAGFQRFARAGVMLTPEETVRLNVTLEVAMAAELITVAAKRPDFDEALEVREVRESAAKDVGEALAKVDGLWKIRKGGVANDVVLRAFQQNNINVIIDGARIYGACPNHMDPAVSHVDFAEIQQVEITKGAFDVRHEGSLGGVVEVVSKAPAPGFSITPQLGASSFGYWNPALTASLSGENVSGLAGYSFRRSKPYRDGGGKRFTERANYRDTSRDADAFDINTGWFRFGVAPRSNHRLEFSATRQAVGQVLYPYLLMDAVYDRADRLGAAYLIHDLAGRLRQVRMQSYFTRVLHWMTDELRISSVGAPRPYGMATLAATRALGGRLEAEFAELTVGFEGYRRYWNAVNTMRMAGAYVDQHAIPDVRVSVAGWYGEYRRVFAGKLRVTAGGRIGTASSEARRGSLNQDLYWAYKGATALSRRDTSPSGSVRLAYSLPRGLEVFTGLGHTARLPDPQERYFALKRSGSDWVGNPNLRPVENTEIDAGFNYRVGWFFLRPTVYYSRLANFIIVHNQPRVNLVPSVMNSAARSFENTPARIYGGELTYGAGLGRTIGLSGGFSWSRGSKEPNPALRVLDRDLAEIPPLRARAALRYGKRRFFAEAEGLAAAAQERTDSDLREDTTPGYAVLNLKAGVHARKLNLAAGIDNLFDRLYYEHFSYQRDPFRFGSKVPEPGRTFYLTLSYGF